jgi:hypothetical protein
MLTLRFEDAMADIVKISVLEALGTGELVDTEDGQKLHALIAEHIEKGDQVTLSFAGTEQIITAFLNAAIGQLYNEFDEGQIRRQLRFEDLNPVFAQTVIETVTRAKAYFANKERANAATKKILGNDE